MSPCRPYDGRFPSPTPTAGQIGQDDIDRLVQLRGGLIASARLSSRKVRRRLPVRGDGLGLRSRDGKGGEMLLREVHNDKLLRKLKSSVKRVSPRFVIAIYSKFIWSLVIRPRWRRMGMANVFREHYATNSWRSEESRSGTGSTEKATTAIRSALPAIISTYNIRSILDIPCGDFNWMKLVDLPVDYIGADIVKDIVERNRQLYSTPTRRFKVLDVTSDQLPSVDLILCRDCLFHFSFDHVHKSIANVKRSGSKYILLTTNIDLLKNRQVVTGEYRRMNMQQLPFKFPDPIYLVKEQRGDDAHLALWRISDLLNR